MLIDIFVGSMPLYSDEALYNSLKELEVIPLEKLEEAYNISKNTGMPLREVLLEKDLLSDENLGRIEADLLGLPFVRLAETVIPDKVLRIIPEVVARKQQVIAFKEDRQGLHIALADPTNIQIEDFIKKKTGLPLKIYLATERDVRRALRLYAKDVKQAFTDIIEENIKKAKGAIKAEPPIIKLVDTIINYAYQNRASDIHIEPLEKYSLVRFRIDGVLHDIVHLPSEIHPRIVTRIKVLANLRTDEHLAAQDGKLQFSTETENLDIRVSIVPITEGEKIVMRLLSERSRQFSLTDLGLSPTDIKKVRAAYERAYGMILATGPTGAGKTTTLYSIVKILNKREVNIMTIEDPVEYDIEGVNQIQVNPKTGLTFASGLRSIVRQDPDIILVGEIRDEETADIAINFAMTGHMVLSTLHTNDAATAIPRLLDMGIEPFLLASTLDVVIAQRLVRRICNKCRVSVEIDPKEMSSRNKVRKRRDISEEEKKIKQWYSSLLAKLQPDLIANYFDTKENIRVYYGKGCSICHQTGYQDRIGIFEVLVVDQEIREAIAEQKDASVIKRIAVKNGMKEMFKDGLDKVRQGLTTIEEVIRVTKD